LRRSEIREVETRALREPSQHLGSGGPVCRVGDGGILLPDLLAVVVEPVGVGAEDPEVGVEERPVERGQRVAVVGCAEVDQPFDAETCRRRRRRGR
jgi:hypothetical protein